MPRRRYELEMEIPTTGQKWTFTIKVRAKLEPLRIKSYELWSFPARQKTCTQVLWLRESDLFQAAEAERCEWDGRVRAAGHQMALGEGAGQVLKAKKDCRLETDTIRSVLKIVAQLSCRKWQEKEARGGVGRVGTRPKRGAEEPVQGTGSRGDGRRLERSRGV